jgi:hypothetical protein
MYLPLSAADLILAQRLLQPRTAAADPGKALGDAFRLRTRTRAFVVSDLKFPEAKETGDQLTLKRLQECREMHNFLHGIAGGLKLFYLVGQAARSLLPLHCQALAARRLRDEPGLTIEEFTIRQEVSFAVRQFHVYTRRPMLDHLARTVGDVAAHVEAELARRLRANRPGDRAELVFLVAAEFVNEWKARNGDQRPIIAPSPENEVPLARSFLELAHELADAFVRQRLSRMNWGIPVIGIPPDEQEEQRAETVADFLKFNFGEPVSAVDTVGVVGARQIIAQATPATVLLGCAEATLREKFRTGEDAFGFGGILDLLMEIHRALMPLLESDSFRDDVVEQRALLARIAGQDMRFVTWNILRAIAMVEGAMAGTLQELPGIESYGKEIIDKLRQPLESLRLWFGLREGALKLPILGEM